MARSGRTAGYWTLPFRLVVGTLRFLWKVITEFLPLEIAGISFAVGFAWLAFHASDSYGLGAAVGEIGEFIGYYGYAFIREYRRHTHQILRATFGRLSEFIPAEIFDWTIGITLTYHISQRFDDYRLGVLVGAAVASCLFTAIVLTVRGLKALYRRRRSTVAAGVLELEDVEPVVS